MHGNNEKYEILIRKPEKKKLCEKTRCRWEGNIKMYAKLVNRTD
jgi:hypothetical protein